MTGHATTFLTHASRLNRAPGNAVIEEDGHRAAFDLTASSLSPRTLSSPTACPFNQELNSSMRISLKIMALIGVLVQLTAGPSFAAIPPTMCLKGDQPVFSCPLAGATKTVSLCAAGDVVKGTGHYYYAYGRDVSHAELTYPASGGQGEFTRSHLMFAGNTGGFAYAFASSGFKYVLYSISGADNLENQGLVVFKDGEDKPIKSTRCQAGKVSYAEDRSLIRPTLKWKSDPAIEDHGIPAP